MKFHLVQTGVIGRRAEIEAGVAGQRSDLYQRFLAEVSETLANRYTKIANEGRASDLGAGFLGPTPLCCWHYPFMGFRNCRQTVGSALTFSGSSRRRPELHGGSTAPRQRLRNSMQTAGTALLGLFPIPAQTI